VKQMIYIKNWTMKHHKSIQPFVTTIAWSITVPPLKTHTATCVNIKPWDPVQKFSQVKKWKAKNIRNPVQYQKKIKTPPSILPKFSKKRLSPCYSSKKIFCSSPPRSKIDFFREFCRV